MYLNFQIKLPAFIENSIIYFVLRYRKKHFGYPYRLIKLIRSDKKAKPLYAKVDAEDYEKLVQFDWYAFESANNNHYAFRLDGRKFVYMHRQIMRAPKGSIVDHKDGNAINNIKTNLRFATPSQNTCNSIRTKKGSSKFRGVCWIKSRKKWRADIYYNNLYIYLGYFDNEEDAARAYDEAAKIYHGEFAVLNFTTENTEKQEKLEITARCKKRQKTGIDVKSISFIILLLCIFAIKQAETDMIKIKELRKRFGPIVAVDGVSFEVEKGQVLGFLGPNGAGKSTVMRMLACFLRPDSGTAQICGFDILKNPIEVRRNIGYLAENVPAYNEMTVGAFLNFVCDARSLEGQKRKQALDKIVSMCHIESVYHQSIETLSKGYKRRIGLAQALMHDPPVLILDEPTDGLDPNQKFEVRQLIGKMAKEKCIVISTHILEEVEAVCDRAIIIARGQILADSTPDKLKTEFNGTLDEVFRKITAHKVA